VIGGAAAPSPVGGAGLGLPAALRLRDVCMRQLGEDWLLEGDPVRP
jgi:hypothetical protein